MRFPYMTDETWYKRRANLDDLKKVRRYIRERLEVWDVDASSIYDLMMAATEAMTNIILHGYHGQAGLIKVSVQNDGNDVAITLQDESASFDPNNASRPDITLPLEQRPLGGVGIFLMQDCMDQIIHEVLPQGGNKLTLIKRNIIRTADKEV
jgi:serine/threonine-protein kinase RsbW